MEGLVVKNTGSWYVVKIDGDNKMVNCKIKGNFRLKGIRTTNPVAVGDRVTVAENADGTGFITAITPRRNYIIRRASNLSKESHIIASNLDQAFLVVTFAAPMTATVFIDRFLATAEAYRVPVVIVVNKIDALDEEWLEFVDSFAYLYESIGYEVRRVSAETGEGIDGLRAMLEGKVTLFSGNSGVGKSTLINRLIPGLDLKTAAISEAHQTGMHTTTFSEMYPLADDAGGYIISAPGQHPQHTAQRAADGGQPFIGKRRLFDRCCRQVADNRNRRHPCHTKSCQIHGLLLFILCFFMLFF